ncbi:MAG: metabolite traffic protein EboE [Pedobacter sp.]
MSKIPGRLITYCTNIHPGETWEKTFSALKMYIPVVKAAVAPCHSFPIGLRLSNRAATELTDEKNRAFTAWLNEQDCFIPTINGFPFGSFHQERIKEQVYLPDWQSHERADYTIRLARLLASWLPEGVTGSISTVPLGFKSINGINDFRVFQRELESVLSHLKRIFDETGKTIMLALEPEPGCLLETTEEVCCFFDSITLPARLMEYLGICYDCCHQAVEFEDPANSLNRLVATGIPIAKVQVSSALQVSGTDSAQLMAFNEPCYLHQVVVRLQDGKLLRYKDLPDAISCHESDQRDEWRCHFHLPIFHSSTRNIGTTQGFLTGILPLIPKNVLLEVETYTWDILPAELHCGNVTNSIIREIQWLKEQLHA